MGKYFGTDGFRGKAGAELNSGHAFKIGRYLGWFYGKNHENDERAKIVIGKDTRRSSYTLENALAAGITASGADAYLLHVTTTPSVSFITRDEGFDCGIMVSASHNPFFDNGIKLMNGEGEKMDESVEKEISNQPSFDQIPDDEETPAVENEILIHYQSGYKIGNDMYDEVFSIDQGDTFRGECGISIGETLNNTEPKAVTAFRGLVVR